MNKISDSHRLKISNPERLGRILEKICQANLNVVIRTDSRPSVAVKGRAQALINEGHSPHISIAEISDRGRLHLGDETDIQVEFIMLSSKVVFRTKILVWQRDVILLSLPSSLISIERRKNLRQACSENLAAFITLSSYQPKSQGVGSPVVMEHLHPLKNYLGVVDLSMGGLCATARFPEIIDNLTLHPIDDQAQLILPMQSPVVLPMQVRWVKRIKEYQSGPHGQGGYIRQVRFGVEFRDISEANANAVGRFMKQLSQSEAI